MELPWQWALDGTLASMSAVFRRMYANSDEQAEVHMLYILRLIGLADYQVDWSEPRGYWTASPELVRLLDESQEFQARIRADAEGEVGLSEFESNSTEEEFDEWTVRDLTIQMAGDESELGPVFMEEEPDVLEDAANLGDGTVLDHANASKQPPKQAGDPTDE